ncbi:MAG: hypothetical protein GW947_04740, partial [Candidatus Pacebacteria bacterium]|nr:hypothetical protein [Candidatus Paceibacterota bacterium]
MINAEIETTNQASVPPVSSPVGTTTPATPPARIDKRPSKKMPLKFILGAFILLILVLASGVGLYLSQTSQDLRNQAAINCGGITCSNGRTAGPDCNAPHSSCDARAQEFCGAGVSYTKGTPGSCTPGGGGTCATSDCRGSCSNSPSCGYAGDCSLCSESDATPEKGKRRFVCRGQSHSGCNDAMGSYIPALSGKEGGIGTITPEHYCTTVQLDSWGPAGSDARVAYIGNHGQVCVEGSGCTDYNNPSFWDC